MNQLRLGYLFGFGAYFMWGFFPAYFKLLKPSGAVEILAHRIVWSMVFMVIVISVMRRWRSIAALVKQPKTFATITAAAILLSLNWGVYVYAVNANHVVETALGYFINPLIVIVLGVLVLGERLRWMQWLAVAVGTGAVLVLTVDYGRLPWIALFLAVSFGLYGLLKKRLALPPADGLFIESAILSLPALGALAWLSSRSEVTFGQLGWGHSLLLASAGALTAIPLLLFAASANRIPLSALGMLQYVGPTLQLALGVFVFHEPMGKVRLIGFGLVWLALAIFSWDGIRTGRRQTLLARIDRAAKPA